MAVSRAAAQSGVRACPDARLFGEGLNSGNSLGEGAMFIIENVLKKG